MPLRRHTLAALGVLGQSAGKLRAVVLSVSVRLRSTEARLDYTMKRHSMAPLQPITDPQVALGLHHSMAAGHFAAERHISRWGARMAATHAAARMAEAQAATTAQVPDIFCGKLDTPP